MKRRLTLALLLTVACTAEARDAGPVRFERLDSAGVEIARNAGAGVRWLTLEEALRVEGDERDERTLLVRVGAIDVGPDGSLLVEIENAHLRIYDPDGALVREMGGAGEGPGEFRMITSVGWTDAGVTAFDVIQRKFVTFSTGGRLGEEIPLPRSLRSVGWAVIEPDRLLVRLDAPVPPGLSDGDRFVRTGSFHPVDPTTGEPGEAIATVPLGTGIAAMGGREATFPRFDTVANHVLTPREEVVGARGPGYAVHVLSSDGTLLRRITRDFEPVPLGDEARARFEERTRERYRNTPITEAELRFILEAQGPGGLPHVPPVGAVAPVEGGGIWVFRADLYRDPFAERMHGYSSRDDHRAEGRVYEYFDPDGRYVGSVRLPADFTPRHFAAARIVGVARDRLGVESIVGYAVVGGT